jgi:hypothetical protein
VKDIDRAKIIMSVIEFKAKLTLWMSHTKRKTLLHFPHLKKIVDKAESEENAELWPLRAILKN